MTDWTNLRDSFDVMLKNALMDTVDATAEDLDGPVRKAANRLAVAVRNKRTDLLDEIRDDLALRLHQQQVRVKANATQPLDALLTTGINMLFNGAIAALGAVRR